MFVRRTLGRADIISAVRQADSCLSWHPGNSWRIMSCRSTLIDWSLSGLERSSAGEYGVPTVGLRQGVTVNSSSDGMNGVLIGACLVWRGVAGEYGVPTVLLWQAAVTGNLVICWNERRVDWRRLSGLARCGWRIWHVYSKTLAGSSDWKTCHLE